MAAIVRAPWCGMVDFSAACVINAFIFKIIGALLRRFPIAKQIVHLGHKFLGLDFRCCLCAIEDAVVPMLVVGVSQRAPRNVMIS